MTEKSDHEIAGNEFAKIEFTQNYQLMIHYHNVQNRLLAIAFTFYTAIIGARIYYKPPGNGDSISVNWLPVLGICGGLFLIFLLVANRYYFALILHKLAFLRDNFLFNDPIWKFYPQVDKAQAKYCQTEGNENEANRRFNYPTERIQMLPKKSLFKCTVYVIAIINGIIVLMLDFSRICTCIEQCKMLIPFLVMILAIVLQIGVIKYGAGQYDDRLRILTGIAYE